MNLSNTPRNAFRAVGFLTSLLLAAGCSSVDNSTCGSSGTIHVVKQLLLGSQESAAADGFLDLSDTRQAGSSGNATRCEAHFALGATALATLKRQIKDLDGDIAKSARQAQMSDDDIHAGITDGTVDYTVEKTTEADGSTTTHVTLSNFNVARAAVLSKYLRLSALLGSVSEFHAPASLSWDAKSDGDPKLFRGDGLELTLSSKPGSGNPTPNIHVEGYGSSFDHDGQAGFETAGARILVGKLDPSSATNQVVFMTYSGGAHCCTQIDVLTFASGQWASQSIGSWDGEPLMTFPADIDGDRVPDIVLYDGAFNYTFASYAGSYAPPLIFNLVNGTMLNVSSEPRYARYYRERMTEFQANCILHSNAACAAFVAAASRIGDFSYAFQFLLDNYDKTGTWQLPKLCHVLVANGSCPTGQEFDASNYPAAVAGFLAQNGYPVPSDLTPQETFAPTFDCSKVHSQVLNLVCATPQLSMLDQELAASYVAAKAATKTTDDLRTAEIAWIKSRNNSVADVDALTVLYKIRIAELEEFARTNSPPPAQ